MIRLLAFAHHPIQYQAPIFRALATQLGGSFHVHFKDMQLGQGAVDPGFGIKVTWDTPVLDGYASSGRAAWQLQNPALWAQSTAAGVLRRLRPQAVLLFLGYNDPWTLEILAAARLMGVPVLWRFEGSDTGQRSHAAALVRDTSLTALYSQVAGFLSIGKHCREHLRHHGVPETKIWDSPYNVEDQLFESLYAASIGQRGAVRAELGLGPEHFAFIFCGKLIPRKDPLMAVEAAEQTGVRERIALVFVGTGELMEPLRARVRAALGPRGILTGFANQTQLGRYYVASDAAVLPSHRETWGLVVNEAQHFHLPSIVSDHVECHHDLIVPFETGFVFPDGDTRALARYMEYLVTHPDEARRMGELAAQRIKGYTVERATVGILAALEAVTASRAA